MKTVLISGCEGQVGKLFVKHLLLSGYNVIGLDIADKSENDIEYYRCDITDKEDVSRAFDKINGPLNFLLNVAGVSVFSPFEERTFEEIDFVMDVNIKGNILLTQNAFNRFFKVQKSGAIINIGSIYGVVAGDMQIYNEGDRRTPEIYGATKAAVINLTKYFAAYMAPFSVRANCISPGGIFNNQNKDFVEKYSAKVPLKRMAKCQEMLSTLDYLMSDDSSYVTGQNILVDGGLTSL